MPGGFSKVSDLPAVIPVFPLDEALLLPHGGLPLNIFEPRYLNMVDDALRDQRVIGMIQTRPGGPATRPHLQSIGCLGKITSFSETPDGRYLITLTGLSRFTLVRELQVATPYRQISVDYAAFENDIAPLKDDTGFDRVRFLAALKPYLDHKGLDIEWEAAREAPCEALVNSLAMGLPFDAAEKQALLEARTVAERRAALIALMEIDAATDDDEPGALQ